MEVVPKEVGVAGLDFGGAVALVLRTWRRSLGMRQGAAAKVFGVSRKWLNHAECGRGRWDVGRLVKVAGVMGIPVWVLVDLACVVVGEKSSLGGLNE